MGVRKSGNKAVYPICMPSNYGGLGSLNCYIYACGDDFTLIDAGLDTKEYRAFFEMKLVEYGIDAGQITRIVLTHFHEDHIGLVSELVARYGMPVYASERAIPRLSCDEDYLRQKLAFYEKVYADYGVATVAKTRLQKMAHTLQQHEHLGLRMPIRLLVAGEQIAGLHSIATPGHSPDSISLYDTDTGWLFTGDFLLASGTASALLDHDDCGEILPSIAHYSEALHVVRQLNSHVAFPGHGEMFEQVEKVIENSLAKFEYKLQKVVTKIAEGHETAKSLGEAIYGPRFAKFFVFTISDIVGLTLLAEQRGLITRTLENGEWVFRNKN